MKSHLDRFLKMLVFAVVAVLYRVRAKGLEHIPKKGGALLVANHVSFVDALILLAKSPRMIRFVMHEHIYRVPWLNPLMRLGRVIPIDRKAKNAATYQAAMASIDQALADGELVCIFPEGKLTRDGEIDTFKPGIERVLERRPVPVVPIALRGLWGSRFSLARVSPPKPAIKRRRPIELHGGSPISPFHASAATLQRRVAHLRGPHR